MGAASLKEKVQSQQFAKNLMGMFGKQQQPPQRADNYEEGKEEDAPQADPQNDKEESATNDQ